MSLALAHSLTSASLTRPSPVRSYSGEIVSGRRLGRQDVDVSQVNLPVAVEVAANAGSEGDEARWPN